MPTVNLTGITDSGGGGDVEWRAILYRVISMVHSPTNIHLKSDAVGRDSEMGI